jgi:hypothetical protein
VEPARRVGRREVDEGVPPVAARLTAGQYSTQTLA